MMLFRIARKKYIRDLSGSGARIYGGRWNHKGTSLLYTSKTASLAALELLVNTSITTLPNDLQLMALSIPDSIKTESIDIGELPVNWLVWPAPEKLSDMGTDWEEWNSALILEVPSAVIPQEKNVLVNPAHPDFDKVKIETVEDFRFNDRMLQ